MKKIGLVTLHKNNFGSILQCFSVKHYMESIGYECVVIEICGKEYIYKTRIQMIYDLFITLLDSPHDFLQFFKLRKANSIEREYLSKKTQQYMEEFVGSKLLPKQYSVNQLREIAKKEEYIAFIVGSDQVWNASRKISDFYFLKFVPDCKKIALAPSFGVSEIPKRYKRSVSKNLKKFDNLSVREETGVEIIYNLTGKNAIRLPDPTLMYGKEQWGQIVENKISEKDYIFIHFLSKPSSIAVNLIKDISVQTTMKFVLFGYKHTSFDSIGNVHFLDGGPLDYVNYIANARYVFTDSYHSTLFSVNFNTPFLTFDRKHLHKYSQKSRIVDLLIRYGLIDRFVEKSILVEEMKELSDWKSEELLSSDRELIKKYIAEEIKRVQNN